MMEADAPCQPVAPRAVPSVVPDLLLAGERKTLTARRRRSPDSCCHAMWRSPRRPVPHHEIGYFVLLAQNRHTKAGEASAENEVIGACSPPTASISNGCFDRNSTDVQASGRLQPTGVAAYRCPPQSRYRRAEPCRPVGAGGPPPDAAAAAPAPHHGALLVVLIPSAATCSRG